MDYGFLLRKRLEEDRLNSSNTPKIKNDVSQSIKEVPQNVVSKKIEFNNKDIEGLIRFNTKKEITRDTENLRETANHDTQNLKEEISIENLKTVVSDTPNNSPRLNIEKKDIENYNFLLSDEEMPQHNEIERILDKYNETLNSDYKYEFVEQSDIVNVYVKKLEENSTNLERLDYNIDKYLEKIGVVKQETTLVIPKEKEVVSKEVNTVRYIPGSMFPIIDQ